MHNLLQLELRKLVRAKSFYICTGIMAALAFFAAAILSVTMELVAAILGTGIQTCWDFMTMAFSESEFCLVAGIFVALFVCEDYERKTVKNIFARGYSNAKLSLAKLVAVWFSTTLMLLVVWAVGLLGGYIFLPAGKVDAANLLATLGAQYAACMASISVSFFLSILLRKKSTTLFADILAPTIVGLLLSLASTALKLETVNLGTYWVSNLAPATIYLGSPAATLREVTITALIYIAVLPTLGIFLRRKSNI